METIDLEKLSICVSTLKKLKGKNIGIMMDLLNEKYKGWSREKVEQYLKELGFKKEYFKPDDDNEECRNMSEGWYYTQGNIFSMSGYILAGLHFDELSNSLSFDEKDFTKPLYIDTTDLAIEQNK